MGEMTDWCSVDQIHDGEDENIEVGDGLCEECGKYPADTPSTLCAGCDAYAEHQGGW